MNDLEIGNEPGTCTLLYSTSEMIELVMRFALFKPFFSARTFRKSIPSHQTIAE